MESNLSYLTYQSAVVPKNAYVPSSQVLVIYLAFLHSCAVVAATHSLLFSSPRQFLRFDFIRLGLIVENNCADEHAV
jgi:hypothetical protein